MTDNLDVEQGGTEQGDVSQPEKTSSIKSAPSSAIDAVALKALLDPIIQEEVNKRFQSAKDKRIAGQEARISALEESIARYESLKGQGKTKEQAIDQMRLEDDIETLKAALQERSDVSQTKAPGKGGDETAQADPVLSSMIKALNLDANSPEITAIVRDVAEPSDRIRKVVELAASGKAPAPPVTPGQRLPTTGGGTTTADDIDTITQEMQELEKHPSKNMKRYLELSDKLAQLGIGKVAT